MASWVFFSCMFCKVVFVICQFNSWIQRGKIEYFISNETVQFGQIAVERCADISALLVVLKDPTVRVEIIGKIPKPPILEKPFRFYIGLLMTAAHPNFVWTDGTNISDGKTFWQTSHPLSFGRSTVFVVMGGDDTYEARYPWYSVSGISESGKYICERNVYRPTVPGTTAAVTTVSPGTNTTSQKADIALLFTKQEYTFAPTVPLKPIKPKHISGSGILIIGGISIGAIVFMILVVAPCLSVVKFFRSRMSNSTTVFYEARSRTFVDWDRRMLRAGFSTYFDANQNLRLYSLTKGSLFSR